jgi:hypothetical protein
MTHPMIMYIALNTLSCPTNDKYIRGLLFCLSELVSLPVEGGVFDFSFHDFGEAFKQYFAGNIIFLAGAAAFKRNAFLKTMLCFAVLFIVCC